MSGNLDETTAAIRFNHRLADIHTKDSSLLIQLSLSLYHEFLVFFFFRYRPRPRRHEPSTSNVGTGTSIPTARQTSMPRGRHTQPPDQRRVSYRDWCPMPAVPLSGRNRRPWTYPLLFVEFRLSPLRHQLRVQHDTMVVSPTGTQPGRRHVSSLSKQLSRQRIPPHLWQQRPDRHGASHAPSHSTKSIDRSSQQGQSEQQRPHPLQLLFGGIPRLGRRCHPLRSISRPLSGSGMYRAGRTPLEQREQDARRTDGGTFCVSGTSGMTCPHCHSTAEPRMRSRMKITNRLFEDHKKLHTKVYSIWKSLFKDADRDDPDLLQCYHHVWAMLFHPYLSRDVQIGAPRTGLEKLASLALFGSTEKKAAMNRFLDQMKARSDSSPNNDQVLTEVCYPLLVTSFGR